MLEHLTEQPADKILMLMQAFRDDPRDTKIDLGVGVYKNADGVTPVMKAVKAAEKKIWEEQESKSYTSLAGEPLYIEGMIKLVLDGAVDRSRIGAVTTPGGTGAIRQAMELIKKTSPQATVWVSNPTWPNHVSILNYLGMRHTAYSYFNTETRDVDFDAMMADLAGVKAGDLVLLHGCCHNPTGANLTLGQWKEVVALINEKGAVPFIDLAYQGFGDGLEADALATRLVAENVGECLIAASCSKNFGIYRERTGILMAIAKDAATAKLSQGMLQFLNRQNYSFPPDHGARVVATILGDDALRQMWIDELEETRLSMLALRQQLADELKRLTNSDRFDFIAKHRGMFSQIGTTPEKVEVMRAESGIYMVSDSRLNIAGLNATTVPLLAKAIVDAGV